MIPYHKMLVLTRMAAQHGVSLGTCLAGCSIDEQTLNDPLTEVAPSQSLLICANVAAAVPEHVGIGIEYGRRLGISAFGDLAHALKCKPTLLDVVEAVAVQYLELADALVPPHLEEEGDDLRIVFEDAALVTSPAARKLLIEMHLATTFTILEPARGDSVVAKSVELRFARPDYADDFTAAFGVEACFEGPRNAVTFSRTELLRPLPLANPDTDAAMDVILQRLVADRPCRQPLSGRVRSLLQRDPCHIPTLDAVADELRLSRRSLSRRLEAEGHTFRALAEEVRCLAAERFLADAEIPIEEVAAKVGYSDRGGFIRAFRRWHGVTPAAWRRGDAPDGAQRVSSHNASSVLAHGWLARDSRSYELLVSVATTKS